MGYDAFGLPAEQYAIQTGQHPAVTTEQNINRYREQMDKIGFCYDWEREVRTCEPEYYKWTQWAFLKMYDHYYCHECQKARPIKELVAVFAEKGSEGLNVACTTPLKFTAEQWNAYTEQEKEQALNEFYEGFFAEYKDFNVKTYTENTDNFVALYALQSLIGEFEDSKLDSLLNLLAPELQEHKFVQGMQKAIKARINTAEGKPFIDFTVNSVVGMTRSVPPQPKYADVKFSDYVGKGKYILVDFWAPWCGPCKREIPNLKAVYDKYAGKNFDILSIAVWERQPVQVTIDTAAELGMNWSHINNAGSVPTEIYGVEGIPHLMLIGPDGTILKRGFHGAEGINAAVAEYLD